MAERKNYYEILGLSESDRKLQGDEFKTVLKRQYKKLALKYHPDKQQGKSDAEQKKAEDKFKEIGEAYSVLSDDAKRQEYDNPMNFNSFNTNFNGNGFDIFDSFIKSHFSDYGNFKQQTPQGSSIRLTIKVSLEDLYNGTVKKIRYKRNTLCDKCHGTGLSEHSKKETCQHCGGTGQLFSNNGMWQSITTCPYCKGKGFTIANPCDKCQGNGLVSKIEECEVSIPKGAPNGGHVVLKGLGHEIPNGTNGDLLVVINELEHSKFVRDGNDLYFQMDIPLTQALLGNDITVTTIDGKKLTTNIKPLTTEGKIRFAKQGMPKYGSNDFGDMYGIIKVKMPKKLSEEDKQLLKQLSNSDNFK